MQAFLIDVQNDKRGKIETEGRLEDLYALIGCRCIDIVVRKIRGHSLNVVCDDEGLLVENPRVSAMTSDMSPALCGNLVVFGMDEETNDLRSLNEDELEALSLSTMEYINLRQGCMQPVLAID